MEVKFVKNLEGSWIGDARLYKTDKIIKYNTGFNGETERYTNYIVVSALFYNDSETYIFPSDAQGEVLDWGKLPGSIKNTLNHQEAIDGFIKYYK